MLLLLALAGARASSAAVEPDVPLTAEGIMARVAANQDRTEAERTHFVYLQHAHLQSRKGSTVMCDEVTETRVTPSATGQHRTLLSLDGHLRDQGRTVHYIALPSSARSAKDTSPADREDSKELVLNVGDKETVLDADDHGRPVVVDDTDIDLVENMRRNFTSDKDAKDGVNAGLFPLTSAKQQGMQFELKGRASKNGHETFHIVFRPKDKEEFIWKGEAWIDAQDFQPVVIRTALSRGIPLAVRLLLGTNVPGLGFTVVYAPHDAVWFPSSFGTEFKLHVLFAFRREMVVDVVNRSFERTHVTSTVHAAGDTPRPPEAQGQAPRR